MSGAELPSKPPLMQIMEIAFARHMCDVSAAPSISICQWAAVRGASGAGGGGGSIILDANDSVIWMWARARVPRQVVILDTRST